MVKSFKEAVENRRSYYDINNEMVVSHERVREIVEHSVTHAPSAFNSQSARAVILLGKNHSRLWDIVASVLKKVVPEDAFDQTEKKLQGFKSGAGTILFFEDQQIVKKLQADFPLYAEAFPLYSIQSSGMTQYIVWTALEEEGFGASLQHYNPLIDTEVAREWNLPDSWRLYSQLVFGKPQSEPGEKTFSPIEGRVKYFS